MSYLSRIFGGKAARARYRPLYEKVVALGRDPAWYREGRVPDTMDGRFDMIAAVLAFVLLRLEQEGEAAADASVQLAEIFIDDMEGTIRQIGIGDLMVGKHVGKMMGALGGRLSAFRAAAAEEQSFETPVLRNIFHDAPPSDEALAFVSSRLERLHQGLVTSPADLVLAGELVQP